VRGKDVDVEWMPFELRPEPHPTLEPGGNYLQEAWARSVYPIAERMGVKIVLPAISPQPHTRLAFEGYQHAKERGKGNEYNHAVLEAFFREGKDIGSAGVLAGLAAQVGLDVDEFRRDLETGAYREAHRRALEHAYGEAGITAVPTFVIGDRVLAGLQAREDLEEAIAGAAARGKAG
jgi:predicted DsbA family dithiol-disulfide isomerase